MPTLQKRYFQVLDWISRHPRVARRLHDFVREELVRRGCMYEGRPMPIALAPILLEPHEHALFRRASEILARVIGKVVRRAFDDARLRRRLTFADIPFEWQAADPGYPDPIPLARLDALFDGRVLKFVEFNCDNPGGKGWTDVYEEIVAEVPVFASVIPPRSVTHTRRIASAVFTTVLDCFNRWKVSRRGAAHEQPSVALVDYAHSEVQSDTEIVRDHFISRGVNARLLDPRRLRRAGGRLECEGVRFNVVLRCLKAMELLEFPEDNRDMVRAGVAGEVCVVNPFRSVVGGEKNLLSILTNPEHHDLFTGEERAVLRAHVPWTRACDETETTLPGGQAVRLGDHLIRERERLVLKPSRGYGGKGVLLGRDTDPVAWREAVHLAEGDPDWVVQEYVEVPTLRTPVFEGERVVFKRKYFNLSPFVFGGRYAGALGRTSDLAVINVAAGGSVISVYNATEPAGDAGQRPDG